MLLASPRSSTVRIVVAAAGLCLLAACAPLPKSTGAKGAKPPTTAAPAPAAVVRPMTFPLANSVRFSDTFGAARSGGRGHEGQDLMAPKGLVAVAAATGTVTYLRHDATGLSGNMLRITDAEGWQYVYIHLNNDTPGTDDGANRFDQAFADGMRRGQKVVAGEPVGFVGDSGNAESTGSHLHFELRDPNGVAVNAYPSLVAATVAPRSASAVADAAPEGHVDVVDSPTPGSVRVRGWALDRVVPTSIDVSVYVDGNPLTTATAAGPRPDLAAAFPDRGTAHGFDVTAGGVGAGSHEVCVVAHNGGDGGGSARLGCSTVAVG